MQHENDGDLLTAVVPGAILRCNYWHDLLYQADSLMMASKYLIPFLIAMMLVTGVCNTLLTKYQVRVNLNGVTVELTVRRIISV